MSGERQSVIITTIIGGGLESSSRSLPFLFIAKKRDGAVQQRGLMSRFYSFWGTFSERKNGIAYLFSAPAGRDARTAQAVRPDGRKVSRRTSAGSAPSADGGDVAVPAAGAKRKGHLRFPFLFELLPFLYFLVWRRLPTCDRFEITERQSGYSCVTFANLFAAHRQRTATHVGSSMQARHTRVAQFVCTLLCMAPANISLQTHFILQVLHSQLSTLHSSL